MLRYKFNVLAALKEKGYNSTRLRQETIFGQSTITQLRKGEAYIRPVTIDTLCRLLEIQPGDLLEYIPDPPETASAQPEEPIAEDIF